MKHTTPYQAWTEADRLATLNKYHILDTPAEKAFDDVVKLAGELLDAPIAAVNLIAHGRQWFKAEIGLGVREMPLDDSICKIALFEQDRMIVPNTLEDARFKCNSLVTGTPGLRFYAGELLKTPEGLPLGTLCVLDVKPRPEGLTQHQQFVLETLAKQIVAQLELRKVVHEQNALLQKHSKTEEALRLERDRSFHLLQGMDQGFVFLDLDYRIRQISPGGLKMNGRTEAELLGLTHWEAWPGSEQLPVADAIKRVMMQRVIVEFEQFYTFPDGRKFWLDMRAYPAEGGMALFYRDISERKQIEEALTESQRRSLESAALAESERRRMNALLEAAPVGIGYANVDGKLTVVNSENRRIWGEHPLSNKVDDYVEWKGWWADGSEKQGLPIAPHEWGLSRALEGEEVTRDIIEIEPFGMPGVRRTILLRATPIRDAAERITGAAVAQMDISDRVEAEKALRKSEAHLQSLLEQTAAGICETDLNGKIVRVNDRFCEIVARNRQELLALSMQDITHPDDLPRNIPLFKNVIASGDPFEIEKRYVRPDGSSIWVSNTVSLIRLDGDELVSSVLAVSLDVTERKQAEEALRQADRRKDEFLAMLAHELRNPLAPISAAAELLKLVADDPGQARKAGDIITRQVKHMTELVDDLLDVSRVTRGLVQLEKEDLDLKSVVESAIEQARPLIEARHHVLSTRMDAEHVIVHGDRTRLIQVMANLLSNSCKYTAQGGEISLWLAVQGAQVKIVVEDNGIGISAALLPHIFELFTQAERTPDRSQGGLGIGLALVKRVVALHGGTIEALSPGPGRGSMFIVTLPLADQRQLRNGGKDAMDEQAAVMQKPLAILVVDDNTDAAQTLAALLELNGHQVTVAENGEAALTQAEHRQYQVYILDVGLPDMTGYNLAKKLRERQPSATTTFIALTGYGQAHDRVLSKTAGFDCHFVKPVNIRQLAKAFAEAR